MFGNRKSRQPGAGQCTLIAAGTEVIGELRFEGNIEIQGFVQGNVVASDGVSASSVRLLQGGRVEGDVVAPVVIVDSVIEGNIYAGQRVELAAAADVRGDVHYQVIEMMQGAQVNGSLLYTPSGSTDSNIESRADHGDAAHQHISGAADTAAPENNSTSAKDSGSGNAASSAAAKRQPGVEESEAQQQSALL